MKTFICTCGTSVLTKRNINIDDITSEPLTRWKELQDDIDSIRYRTVEALSILDMNRNISETSAEIKSLVKMGLEKNDKVILLSTDTIDGKLSAEIVKRYLSQNSLCDERSISIEVVDGLQAKDGQRFRKIGLINLFNLLTRFEHDNVVFNPTGGFKSVVPYLSLMGMLFNKPVQYIHEDSNDVISLINIPLLIDEDIIFRVEDKLRRIENESSISKEEWMEGLDYYDRRFDSLIEEQEKEITLSGIGLIFWERFKSNYPEDLERDNRPANQKENKLLQIGVSHHGIDRLLKIADRLLISPFVHGIPNSCNYQRYAKKWVKPLSSSRAKDHLQREVEGICIITDINTDEGFSFLIQTTARTFSENERISVILEKKLL